MGFINMLQRQFNYSLSLFNCQIKKKKLIGFGNRYIYIFEDKLVINKDYRKGNPTRLFSWTQIKKIIWNYHKPKNNARVMKSFTLITEKEMRKYYGDQSILKALKGILSKFVFQESIHDEYEQGQLLGSGNQAIVIQLKHLHSNSFFAAKCIDKKKIVNIEHGVKSVMNEVYIMRLLSPHTSIVNLHEVYEDENSIYLILDFCQGGSLQTEMKKRSFQFSQIEIFKIMESLLSAVEYFHSKDIMHRDIKPENVLFSNILDFSTLKLADFGLAAISKLSPYLYPKCGTPGFVAPEIANMTDKTQGYSKKCDIFSCGVLFHILLTEKQVFEGKDNAEMLKVNKECKINHEDQIYSTLPIDAKDLLFIMLEVNPEKRQDAHQLLQHQYFVNQDINQ